MAAPKPGKFLLKRPVQICKTIPADACAAGYIAPGDSRRSPRLWEKARKAQRFVVHSYPQNPALIRGGSFFAGRIIPFERDDHVGTLEALLGER